MVNQLKMQKTKSQNPADNKTNKFSYLTIDELTYIYTCREWGKRVFNNPLLSTWLFNGTRGPGDRQLGSWDREQQMHPRRTYAIDARAHYGIDTGNIKTHL